MPAQSHFDRLVPALFVLLWSTGWIVAKYAAFGADPLTFLSLRFALAGVVLAVYARISGASWPSDWRQWRHIAISGVLLHAIYLGGVWVAIRQGLPASISALLAALQPILSAIAAPILIGESVTRRQWSGIGLGFAGLLMVLEPKLATVTLATLAASLGPIAINILGVGSVTLGTFYQKRFMATADLRTSTALQYAGALAVTLPAAFVFEPMRIDWTRTMVLTMAWSVLVLSIGAIALMLRLIRQGAVAKTASLIYLIPVTVAVEAWFLFDETLSLLQGAGMAVTLIGVTLASRR